MKLKIGTRKSQLAMWQARYVAQQLESHGVEAEIIGIDTKGDQILNVSIAKIGSKGVFTEELEDLLQMGAIDLAVHSAKDLQSSLPTSFEIVAFTTREQVSDVIISEAPVDLSQHLRLGTSSTRRQALFGKYFPHIETVAIRGNLQTRVAKMRAGDCDALALAYAGVHRMGFDSMIQHQLDTEKFVPPVGQGALAIEVHEGLSSDKRSIIRTALNDEVTERRLLAERAFLKTLDGGCSIPAFGLAHVEEADVVMTGGVISLNGKEMIKTSVRDHNPQAAGIAVAQYVLSNGGEEILREIRKTL